MGTNENWKFRYFPGHACGQNGVMNRPQLPPHKRRKRVDQQRMVHRPCRAIVNGEEDQQQTEPFKNIRQSCLPFFYPLGIDVF